jgi:hypothetical protein
MNTNAAPIVPSVSRHAAPRPLVLHIERVVLDGLPFDSAQALQLRNALERELARLAAQPGAAVATQGFAVPALRAPGLAGVGAGGGAADAARVGRDAARSVFAMLGLA